MPTLARATIFHTPRNPFQASNALAFHEDGALVFEDDALLAVGDYTTLRHEFETANVLEYPNAFILPGFIDTHVHYPQIPILGAMGLRLLEWLETRTLPEEAKLAEPNYARQQAKTFLHQLARNGTTTALVFGAHFAQAMQVFFEEAEKSELRITAGLVLGDRNLSESLHTTAARALEESLALATQWHGRGRLRYAVTPRFSVSCSKAILQVCQELLQAKPDLFFTTHLNEQRDEIAFVRSLFPDATDYLDTYEYYGLVRHRAVYAHNVYPSDSELSRLAKGGSSIAHCASSNMFIGSGLFPMKNHLQYGVHFALGSDVGGGTGFSLFKEGLQAYEHQMLLQEGGYPLTATHLLYLATLAGAKALDLEEQVGDFSSGKQADFIVVKPPEGSTLESALQHAPSPETTLALLFTLAREECIHAVYVGGKQLPS
ncbi:MAG: guanine deaminase [Trueperaceae bacterium]